MRSKSFSIIFVLLLILKSTLFSQGLEFNSTKEHVNNRTTYTVFETIKPVFKDSLCISFDLKVNSIQPWGYILHIVDEKINLHTSLVYNSIDDKKGMIVINYGNNENKKQIPISNTPFQNTHITLNFNFLKGKLNLQVGKDSYVINKISKLSAKSEPEIVFGKYLFYIDVASFQINNLKIQSENNNYFFPLAEKDGKNVSDNTGKEIGFVENPNWLIRKSYYWSKVAVLNNSKTTGYSLDLAKNKVYICTTDTITIVDVNNKSINKFPIENKIKFNLYLGTNFMLENQRKFVYYEFLRNDSNKVNIAELDLNKALKWKPLQSTTFASKMHHHANYLDTLRNRFYAFGGFGNKQYFNELKYYDINSNQWSKIGLNGDVINPRYYVSMGINDNLSQIYIFGGMGNKSGNQTLDRNYFYDFYSVDLKTSKVKKIFENNKIKENFISSRNLVFIEDDKNSFYTFSYKEYDSKSFGHLLKWDIKTGDFKEVADSISISTESIRTNASICYDKKNKTIFLILQEFKDHEDVNKISIYTLNSPPIQLSDLKESKGILVYLIIGISVLVLCCFLIFLFYKFRKNKTLNLTSVDKKYLDYKHWFVDASDLYVKNSIYLFGNFTVYDNKGINISHLFNFKTKQMFLSILLYSFKKEKGISSEDLDILLWPDKDHIDRKNIRNVMINKLRKTLNHIDGVNLIYTDGLFYINIDKPTYCDYSELCTLLSNDADNEIVSELFDIIKRGVFLKSKELVLFNQFSDELKRDILLRVLNVINGIFRAKKHSESLQRSMEVLKFDRLNISVLGFALQSLIALKNPNQSLKLFMYFQAEYFEKYHTEFTITYKQMISENPLKMNDNLKM